MSADERRPPLTIVVAGRNDNYGETFSARFQTFLRHLASLEERHKALFDLIVVEWNPPADRPRMADAFDWSGLPNTRIVTAPPEVHDAIPIPGRMPMLEFFAKNVGVRRALTPFVLSTNPDVILSPDFFDYIGDQTLDPNAFYRADRYDLAPDIVFDAPSARIFELAKQATFEVHTRNTVDPEEPFSHFVDPATPLESWPQSQPVYGETVLRDGVEIALGSRRDPLSGLHTQASGDFIMASRDAWLKVRGHWERTDTYTHLDSYLICHLHAAGFRQHILRRPIMVLHMDHSRDDHKTRPSRPYSETLAEIRQAAAGGLPNPNDENWGLAHINLPETRPSPRAGAEPPAPVVTVTKLSTAYHLRELSRAHALAAAQRAAATRARSELVREVSELRSMLQNASGTETALAAAERERDELRDTLARVQDGDENGRAALFDSRLTQLRAEADEAHAALREAVARHAAERAAADQRYDDVIRLLQTERPGARPGLQMPEDPARRQTAETLLEALEAEGVEREHRIAALEASLEAAHRALAEAGASRDQALAEYRNIMENSRYMKARRALLRILGKR